MATLLICMVNLFGRHPFLKPAGTQMGKQMCHTSKVWHTLTYYQNNNLHHA